MKRYRYNSTIRIKPKKRKVRRDLIRVDTYQGRFSKLGKPLTLPYNKLMAKADDVFSKWVKQRDGECVLLSNNCKGALQNGHLIRRGKKSVRFSEENCHAQCQYHNYLHETEPQHYTKWFIENYGHTMYLDLVDRSKLVRKPTRDELIGIIEKYTLDK